MLADIAQRFDARLVEQIARRWLAWVPDPLTPAERAAGYLWRLSIYRVEFSDNVIFHRTQILIRLYGPRARSPASRMPGLLRKLFLYVLHRAGPARVKAALPRFVSPGLA